MPFPRGRTPWRRTCGCRTHGAIVLTHLPFHALKSLALPAAAEQLRQSHALEAVAGALLVRYVEAIGRFYVRRDRGLNAQALVPISERRRAHHFAQVRRRLAFIPPLRTGATPSLLYYPRAAIDLVPVLFGDIDRAVYVDVSYFAMPPRRIIAAGLPVASELLVALCRELSDNTRCTIRERSRRVLSLSMRVAGRTKRVTFVRCDATRIEEVSGVLPSRGSFVYYALEENAQTVAGILERYAPPLCLVRDSAASLLMPRYRQFARAGRSVGWYRLTDR